MRVLFVLCSVLVMLIFTAGCTWVKVSDAGSEVVIMPADRVAACKLIGTVTTSVKDRIIGVERKEEKVRQELDRLAQNQAAKLNANTLVRASIDDGQGNYIAYRCP